MRIGRKLNFIVLLACFITSLFPVSARKHRYLALDLVSGVNPELTLLMHEKSFNLDLSKTQNVRVRLKVNDLYKNVSGTSSFKVNLYEIISGDRKFVSSQNLTVKRNSAKSRILALDAGYFASPVKNIEIDVFDTSSSLVNTYEAQLMALNLDTQVLADDAIDLSSADCDADTFDDCHLDYLFQKITFEAKPQRQISTRVLRGEDGLYKVTIPVPRSSFNYLGRKLRKKKSSVTINNTGGGTSTGFGETINVAGLNVGDSQANSFNIGYENSQLNINDSVYLDTTGRLGIGVQDPLAWLHIRGGSSTTPSMILNAGTLTDTPKNGALEFDGSNLYFTKGGNRSVIGAAGPQGPQGAQGPAGASGAAVLNGSTINGSFTVTDTINARLFNGQVFNGGVFNGTFYGDGTNLSGVIANNGTVSNLTINNGTINVSTINGDTSLNGNLTVNGRVFAEEFNGGLFYGNGAGLTHINASAIIGVINDMTITNGTVSNASLNDSTLNGTTTINGPIVLTNNGFVDDDLLINGNLTVDEVHARLFNGQVFNGGVFNGTHYGDGSNLTGIPGGNNGEVHDLTVNNGTLNNVNIQNGSTINGATLLDSDLNGVISFLSNGQLEDAVLNGTTVIQDGTLQITLGNPGNGKVLTSDATGNVSWESPSVGSTPWTDLGVILHPTAGEGLVIGGNSIGTADIYMDADGTAVFNKQNSSGSDFRVAGATDDYLIQADVSANNIGIGYNSPTSKLHVNGQVLAISLNGTHYGDGSNLTGVAANNGQVSNLTILNSTINGTLLFDNGTSTTFNNGSVSFVNGVSLDMNGATLEGPVTINGLLTVTNFKMTDSPVAGYVLSTDANGLASWASAAALSGNGDDLGNHTATTDLNLATNSIINADNGSFTNLTASGTINGSVFNGTTFNGGTFNGIFVGDGSGLTGVFTNNGSISNGVLQDATLNGTTIVDNGDLYITTTSPTAGYVLTSDANGLATWQAVSGASTLNGFTSDQFIRSDGSDNFSSGTLVMDSATTLKVNGSVLITSGTPGAGKVLTSDASGNATWQDAAGGSSEFSDQGTFLVPADNSGAESLVIGATDVSNGDIFLGSNGQAVFNEQALDSDFRIEGTTEEYLFFSDASSNRVAIGHSNPDTHLDVDGFLTLRSSSLSSNGGNLVYQSIVDNGDNSGLVTTNVVNAPSGLSLNDVMIAIVAIQSNSTTITPPSGWTTLTEAAHSTDNIQSSIYWKIATASEPSDYTFGFSTAVESGAVILKYNGADLSVPIAAYNGLEASASNVSKDANFPAIDSVSGTNKVLRIITSAPTTWDWSFNGASMTSQGYTQRYYNNINSGNDYTAVYEKDETSGASAVTGNFITPSATTTGYLTYTIVLGEGAREPADPDEDSGGFWIANNGTVGNDGDFFAKITEGGTTKTIKIIDFNNGSLAGIPNISSDTTSNGLTLNGLTASSLVATDASKKLTSVTSISLDSGNVGIGISSTSAKLHVNGDLIADSFNGSIISSTTTFGTSSNTNITAGGGVTVTKSIMKVQGSGGAVTLSANPQVADGSDGQLLVLKGLSDTNTITFIDGNGLSLTDGLSFTLGSKDTLTLIYDSGDDEWIEISRSDK